MAGVLITSETAREYAAKAAESKRKRIEDARKAVEDAFQATDFQGEQLAHTRAEIRRIRGLMSQCTDAKELQAFSTAICKLGEWEQKLDMRPNPGNLKPTSKPVKKSSQSSEPLD
jgi:predicted  nucleic acid-binding Zn-ribbon protein